METIKGTIERVFSDKGNWAAILFRTEEGDRVNANGTIVNPIVGSDAELTGEWTMHPTYGKQFKVSFMKTHGPMTEDGIMEYLCAGFIKGVGPKKAAAIVKMFGMKTLEIVEKDYKQLAKVSGISEAKALEIHDCHAQNNIYMDLVMLLKPTVSDKQIANIYTQYGAKAVETVKTNPYILIDDLYGVGFIKADFIAKAVGVAHDSPLRIQAGISYCLKEKGESEGHCYIGTEMIEQEMKTIVGEDISAEQIADEMMKMMDDGRIIVEDENTIYLRQLYQAETETAKAVVRLLKAKPDIYVSETDCLKALLKMEISKGFALEGKQKDAVMNSFKQCLSVITGGPGTGKSTIVDAIIAAYKSAHGRESEIFLCAPTGKAARRMTEVTELNAKTIHSMLRYEGPGKFGFDSTNPLPCRLLIVDECSMLDIYLTKALLSAVKTGTIVIMIGDIDQLPPIGAGNAFRDLVELSCIPTTKLDLSHRQHGKIAINAQIMNRGSADFDIDHTTFDFKSDGKDARDHSNLQEQCVEQYVKLVETYGVENCCLLTPMRQKGQSATNILNPILRERVNPHKEGKAEVTIHEKVYRVGDRVMQTKNLLKDGIANGDVGTIVFVDKNYISVSFDNGESHDYLPEELIQLIYAYAITVHKSQGSEYDGCVVVASNEHYVMLQRNLIYTAMTRAKQEVILVGNMWAFKTAAKTVKAIQRNTKLKDRITSCI